MKRRAYLFTATFVFVVAFASIACTTFDHKGDQDNAEKLLSVFDPLSLRTNNSDLEPWLDPISFYSSDAYVVRVNNSSTMEPERNASFIGGYFNMTDYLKDHILDHVAKDIGWLKPPTLKFIVNEQGETSNVELIGTCRNEGLDAILVEVINEMPKWEPAKDANGTSIEQVFEFMVVQGGC